MACIQFRECLNGRPLKTQAEKEAAAAVLESGQAESSAKGLAAVSSGLEEYSSLRAAKARTETLQTITPQFESRTGRAAADEILSRKYSCCLPVKTRQERRFETRF